MPKAVQFWNFQVSTMALNIADICAYYPALLIIGVLTLFLLLAHTPLKNKKVDIVMPATIMVIIVNMV